MLVPCPECANLCAEDAASCPKCGKPAPALAAQCAQEADPLLPAADRVAARWRAAAQSAREAGASPPVPTSSFSVQGHRGELLGGIVLVMIAFWWLLGRTGCGGPPSLGTPGFGSHADVTYQVTYAGSWSGMYSDLNGSVSWDGAGAGTMPLAGAVLPVQLQAQKKDDSAGVLEARILHDGKVVATESTSAAYGIVHIMWNGEGN